MFWTMIIWKLLAVHNFPPSIYLGSTVLSLMCQMNELLLHTSHTKSLSLSFFHKLQRNQKWQYQGKIGRDFWWKVPQIIFRICCIPLKHRTKEEDKWQKQYPSIICTGLEACTIGMVSGTLGILPILVFFCSVFLCSHCVVLSQLIWKNTSTFLYLL